MPLPDGLPAIELPHVAEEFEAALGTQPRRSFTVIRPRCEAGKAGEIVVCAADPKRYRLTLLPDTGGPPKSQLQVSEGVTANLRVKSTMISGVPSNRAMVELKFGF
jgi:hypothetical protein